MKYLGKIVFHGSDFNITVCIASDTYSGFPTLKLFDPNPQIDDCSTYIWQTLLSSITHNNHGKYWYVFDE